LTLHRFIKKLFFFVGGNFGKAMIDGCGVCTINVVEDALSPTVDNPSKPRSC